MAGTARHQLCGAFRPVLPSWMSRRASATGRLDMGLLWRRDCWNGWWVRIFEPVEVKSFSEGGLDEQRS
jgi:hypothetical protein